MFWKDKICNVSLPTQAVIKELYDKAEQGVTDVPPGGYEGKKSKNWKKTVSRKNNVSSVFSRESSSQAPALFFRLNQIFLQREQFCFSCVLIMRFLS